jgi:ubiquinone/menaquinone biosynthesis C-methylase UbiE
MPTADKSTRARSFGQVADLYQRARPGYPPEAIAWLLGPEPLDVLDLGAGTGKLTAALLAAGHRVTALEPLPEMRAILAATLHAATAIDGRAEQLPLADDSVDAVVAGSAFHWFEREPTLDEIARVLRPSGVFGLLGNR